MKHWLLFILVISWFCFPLSGQQTNRPDWVKQHPVSGLSREGIISKRQSKTLCLTLYLKFKW